MFFLPTDCVLHNADFKSDGQQLIVLTFTMLKFGSHYYLNYYRLDY